MGQIPANVHVNQVLTNLAVKYRSARFNLVADLILPRIPVDKQTGTFFKYNKADRFTLPNSKRGPKAEAQEATFGSSTDTYACEDYAYKDLVLDSTIANADKPLQPKADTTEFLTDLLQLDRERRVAALCTSTSVITQNTTLSGTSQWSDYANSEPINDVETGKAACFFEPNTMLVPRAVHLKLRHHPDLLERYKYTNDKGVLTPDMLAALFEVENYIVANAKYNSAADGLAASYADVWGKDVLLAYVEPQPQLELPSYGYTMEWKMSSIGGINGFRAREWREEGKGGGGTMIEVDCSHDERIVAVDLAYLIKAAVA